MYLRNMARARLKPKTLRIFERNCAKSTAGELTLSLVMQTVVKPEKCLKIGLLADARQEEMWLAFIAHAENSMS